MIECESYIINSIFELRDLLSCLDLGKEKNKEVNKLYNDLMESDDFTYKEYDE